MVINARDIIVEHKAKIKTQIRTNKQTLHEVKKKKENKLG